MWDNFLKFVTVCLDFVSDIAVNIFMFIVLIWFLYLMFFPVTIPLTVLLLMI